jgi:hypothetical protein
MDTEVHQLGRPHVDECLLPSIIETIMLVHGHPSHPNATRLTPLVAVAFSHRAPHTATVTRLLLAPACRAPHLHHLLLSPARRAPRAGGGNACMSPLAARSHPDDGNRPGPASPLLRCKCIFQVFHMYVAIVTYGCCKSRSGCCIFCKCFQRYVASVC